MDIKRLRPSPHVQDQRSIFGTPTTRFSAAAHPAWVADEERRKKDAEDFELAALVQRMVNKQPLLLHNEKIARVHKKLRPEDIKDIQKRFPEGNAPGIIEIEEFLFTRGLTNLNPARLKNPFATGYEDVY